MAQILANCKVTQQRETLYFSLSLYLSWEKKKETQEFFENFCMTICSLLLSVHGLEVVANII